MSWEMVIGLETHVELNTESKVFCTCKTAFGAEPNTSVCPVCMGYPGVLPVPNKTAIRATVRAGATAGARAASGPRATATARAAPGGAAGRA